MIDAGWVIDQLRDLDRRSGGVRLAWTPTWVAERGRLAALAREEVPGVVVDTDEAGNMWYVLPGGGQQTLLLGSHIDCVPSGGWLDGALGVFAGIGYLRGLDSERTARPTVAVVDWADEEGARFGRSLLGSSLAARTVDLAEVADLREEGGRSLGEVLGEHGVDGSAAVSARRLDAVGAYLELHIEQGPVLEAADRAVAGVSGCLGVRRLKVVFAGRSGHAGAVPMDARRDPVIAASRFLGEVPDAAVAAGGLATVGTLRAKPGTPTAIAETVTLILDIRHIDLQELVGLADRCRGLAQASAERADCEVAIEDVWSIDPIHFDADLVARAKRLSGGGEPLISGPLHDAASMVQAGIRSEMVFVRSERGLSHTREENSSDSDLREAIFAFAALADEVSLHELP